MIDKEDDEYAYYSEEQIKKIIKSLLFEIVKLKDENESLWIMLEDFERMNVDGSEMISESLKNLKIFKAALNRKPEQA